MSARFVSTFIPATALILGLVFAANGQFPIKIPTLSKPETPKTPSTEKPPTSGAGQNPNTRSSSAQTKRVYENQIPSGAPVVINPRVFIQAVNTNEYWKMPNARDVTSWIPEIKVDLFWDDRSPLQTIAEYYNPDGSLWFTEQLQTAGKMLQSNETWTLIGTKSTNATGVFSVKVKNKATGSVIFAGKFKVNKFLASFNAADKNKLGFSVDHDWLVPLGMLNFDTPNLTRGAPTNLLCHVWLKGDVQSTELEAQLHYNGKMISSRKVNSGAPVDERMSKFTVPFDKDNLVKRWAIQFENVLLENGLPYNKEWYANAHFIDKNPGQYTFKLFRNGTQIREFTFSVGADGRLLRPPYSDNFIFPQHGILVPAKVMGNLEKWNPNAWKTDMFYGNPIVGFAL